MYCSYICTGLFLQDNFSGNNITCITQQNFNINYIYFTQIPRFTSQCVAVPIEVNFNAFFNSVIEALNGEQIVINVCKTSLNS